MLTSLNRWCEGYNQQCANSAAQTHHQGADVRGVQRGCDGSSTQTESIDKSSLFAVELKRRKKRLCDRRKRTVMWQTEYGEKKLLLCPVLPFWPTSTQLMYPVPRSRCVCILSGVAFTLLFYQLGLNYNKILHFTFTICKKVSCSVVSSFLPKTASATISVTPSPSI